MIEMLDPKTMDRPAARCARCDREMNHYNVWLRPDGLEKVICWECTAREEKNFFAHRGFGRSSRRGYIPR